MGDSDPSHSAQSPIRVTHPSHSAQNGRIRVRTPRVDLAQKYSIDEISRQDQSLDVDRIEDDGNSSCKDLRITVSVRIDLCRFVAQKAEEFLAREMRWSQRRMNPTRQNEGQFSLLEQVQAKGLPGSSETDEPVPRYCSDQRWPLNRQIGRRLLDRRTKR
jgi:hypothetical protein